MNGAVIPILRQAGIEFDPLVQAGTKNPQLRALNLGQSYRQIVLQQQVAVFEDQSDTRTASGGTYHVYASETEMRGVIDLNSMSPIIVQREIEDIVAAAPDNGTRINQHGRSVPAQQGHGTTVKTTNRFLPSGYVANVAEICVARLEKGFVVLHKDSYNSISMTEGICVAVGNCAVPRMEVAVTIKWKQVRPDLWVSHRRAFLDPFDMLEEKCANLMRDWLLSVRYLESLEEKAQGFTKVEHQWTAELNETGREYGVRVLGIEITTLRFPHIEQQDEQVALQLADTNLTIETSKQSVMKERKPPN